MAASLKCNVGPSSFSPATVSQELLLLYFNCPLYYIRKQSISYMLLYDAHCLINSDAALKLQS